MRKKLILLLLISAIFAVMPQTVTAVTKTSGDLQVTVDEPLFSSSTVWYPGLSQSGTVKVENLSGGAQELDFRADNNSQTGGMAGVLFFKVAQGTTVLYGDANSKTLQDFWDAGEVKILDLAAREEVELVVTLTMNTAAGNEYQGKSAEFDLAIGFVGEEPATVTAAGDGGNGEASAPVCGEPKPNTPGSFSATAGTGFGEVILSWAVPATPPPFTYFLVAYSDTADAPKWGNPNIGTGTTYTVGGLTAGSYYFWVRAGNGCMPGDFVGPESVVLGAGAPGAVTGVPAAGFEEGVLGEATPSAEVVASPEAEVVNGEVRGAEEIPEEIEQRLSSLWWWLLLFFILILLAIIYWYLRRKREQKAS